MAINAEKKQMISELIQPIAIKYGVDRVTLFGSMARGDDDQDSDYDFLISRGKMRSLLQYMSFVNELEELFNTHVDVVSESSPDEYIVEAARKDGTVVYERV